ncbi:MAG: class B sortase [Clostridia bacterium]|nr:class B sortase [Clostridia bacterium]
MKNSSKKVIWRIIGVVFAVLAVVFAVLLFLNLRGCEGSIEQFKKPGKSEQAVTLPGIDEPIDSNITIESETTPPPETEPPIATGELPSEVDETYDVDFGSMYDINPDIHAWITVPGTPIDYPVLQSQVSDLYYERRSYTGAHSVSGCIFTQYYNRPDFSDRNTVLYGHYMLDGTFFGSLHNYKDPEFFNNNRYIYITLPDRVLVYEIFAAYETDNRHVLTLCNYSDDEDYLRYLESCLNPSTMVRTIREGTQLSANDRIITLSTCVSYYTYSSRRYLVQGVLIADVETQ